MSPRLIRTSPIYPPVPSCKYDWSATFDGYEPGEPMGHGASEAEAIADLILTSEYEGPVEVAKRGVAA